MAVLAPARPLNWDVRHRLQLRIISGTALILCAATSAVQIMGYTSTAFSALCLLLAPAWLLTRPARSELIFVGVAAVGFLAFVLSFTVNRLPYLDQRILQWPCFALYFIGIAVLAAGSLDRVFALTAGIAIADPTVARTSAATRYGNSTPSIRIMPVVWSTTISSG